LLYKIAAKFPVGCQPDGLRRSAIPSFWVFVKDITYFGLYSTLDQNVTDKIIGQEKYYNGILHERFSRLMMVGLFSNGPKNWRNSISHQN
jgi:hypothetical protein